VVCENKRDEFNKRFHLFGLDEAMAGLFEEYIESGTLPAGNKEFLLEKILKMVLLHVMSGRYPLKKTWSPGSALLERLGAME